MSVKGVPYVAESSFRNLCLHPFFCHTGRALHTHQHTKDTLMLINTANPTPNTPSAKKVPLTHNSPLAHTLSALANGDRVIIVDSPPGAGKTTLITNLAYTLATRTDIVPPAHGEKATRVNVGAPTRRGATDLALRIGDILKGTRCSPELQSPDTHFNVNDLRELNLRGNSVQDGTLDMSIATMARHAQTGRSYHVGTVPQLFIVDEAYQVTFADFYDAVIEPQALLVGDPGQIGPVVTSQYGTWGTRKAMPGDRCPDAIAKTYGVTPTRIHLPHTYRFGVDTVNVIAPFYDFDFTTARPDTWVDQGGRVPEITVTDTTWDTPDKEAETVATTATNYVGATLKRDGEPDREITEKDILIVVAHNAQVTRITAQLATTGHPGITVLTADKAQGAQYPVVIGVDPMSGRDTLSSHHLEPGRLCVMLSRHQAHLHWFQSAKWRDQLDGAYTTQKQRRTLTAVKTELDTHKN